MADLWEVFCKTGKIEDYLSYVNGESADISDFEVHNVSNINDYNNRGSNS